MIIKCDRHIQASLDKGLTVTTFDPGEAVEVPESVGKMAIKHYGAEEVKPAKKPKE
jgi:hypothetical protein